MRFVCIDDGVPRETVRLLAAACDSRGVEFVRIDAPRFDYTAMACLGAGDLLYRPAVSTAAMHVEQALAGPGVATFYEDEKGIRQASVTPLRLFEECGLPVPRWLPCTSASREQLDDGARWLGGFPLIVKVPGGEGGVGVLRIDSSASLRSLVDYFLAARVVPHLMAYVPDAESWRLIVVGRRIVAAIRNRIGTGDFRSEVSIDPDDYLAVCEPMLERIAVAATCALGVEHAGVDVLRHPSGQAYLLEANFPCYFAHAHEIGGIDVAPAMVSHLVTKADALRRRYA